MSRIPPKLVSLHAVLLDKYKDVVADIMNPTVKQRADRVTESNPEGNVNVGLDKASARLRIKQFLDELGYAPNPDEAGTIKDLSNDDRINLVVETNLSIAQGAGWFIQGNDPAALDAFPAQEMIRIESRDKRRDWASRFSLCAQVVGDVDAARVQAETGRMIARKDSPIWQALGDGEDGSTDTLGNPFPPFAFSSGMGVEDIAYSEAVALGVIMPGDTVKSQKSLLPPPFIPIESERITEYLWNEPKLCDHCDEEKPAKLLSSCGECGGSICSDCKTKGCHDPEPTPGTLNAMQCFSNAENEVQWQKLPLRKDVAERAVQWCNRAFEAGFAAHLRFFEARAYRMRGEAFESLGQKERALRDYELAVEKDPQVGVKKRIASLRNENTKS